MIISKINLKEKLMYTKDKVALEALKNISIVIDRTQHTEEVWGEYNTSSYTILKIYYKGGLIYETPI